MPDFPVKEAQALIELIKTGQLKTHIFAAVKSLLAITSWITALIEATQGGAITFSGAHEMPGWAEICQLHELAIGEAPKLTSGTPFGSQLSVFLAPLLAWLKDHLAEILDLLIGNLIKG